MNLPNRISLFRLFLIPLIVLVWIFPYSALNIDLPVYYIGALSLPFKNILTLILFVIASLSDMADGMIARKTNQITTFGKFLDPIADKILVLAAMIMLVEFGKIPAWIPIIILFREFMVSGYRLIASQNGGEVIAASKWGKIKTVTQMIAIITIFLDKFSFMAFAKFGNLMSTGEIIWNILTSAMLFICVVATIFSGYEYLKNGKNLILSDK